MNGWSRIASLLVFLVLLFEPSQKAVAQSAAQKPPEASVFFQRPAMRSAVLSPSGKRLAVISGRGVDRDGLVVVELQTPLKVTRVAQFNDADVAEFQWVDDEMLVFSVTDQQLGSGETYRSGSGLFAVKHDGTETRALINRVGGSSSAGPTREGALSAFHIRLAVPDGKRSPVLRPREIIVGRVNLNGRELRSVTPILQNIMTGRTREMDMGDAPADVLEWFFDPLGVPRLAATRDGERLTYHRRLDDGRWVKMADTDRVDPEFTIQSVQANGTVYVLKPDGAEGWLALSTFDFDKGRPSDDYVVRTPGFDFSGGLIRGFEGQVLGVRVNTDAEDTVWLHERMKAVQAEVDAKLPGRVNRITCRRCAQPDMVSVVFSYSDRDPGQIWIHQVEGQRWQHVSAVMPSIDPRQMASVDFKRFKARDGREIPVWLTLPKGVQPGKPAPAVVLVHGGPWVRGGSWRWTPYEQFLASRGYLVISPEFRGSTGYGRDHFRAGWRQWGQAMQDDVADALLWAQKEKLATDRACIAGASYGGYATLMGLVRHPELYRCGVAWVAVTDLVLLLTGSPWVADDANRDVRRLGLPKLVGDVKTEREFIERHSPVHQVEHIKAPLFLAFGEADLRVPLAHGNRMREALTKAGRPPLWKTYADEAHSWRLQATLTDFTQRMEAFLAEHLGPSGAPAQR